MSAPATGQPAVDGGGGSIEMGRELAHPPKDGSPTSASRGAATASSSPHGRRWCGSTTFRPTRRWGVVLTHKGPVLDCCFHDDDSGFSASADHIVRRLAFIADSSYRLGSHDGAVSCVEYSYDQGQVITGSWDKTISAGIQEYPKYETSIAALSFSRDGSLLAVASSYTHEKGDIPHPPDKIFIRDVNDFEVKPRRATNLAPPQ
ncbi:hypothetical protein ACQ4PT_042669 [Festuca glaucescens]